MKSILVALLVVLAFAAGYFAGHTAGMRLAAFNVTYDELAGVDAGR